MIPRQPDEVRAELKAALRRRIVPDAYLGFLAASLVALGTWMAWRQYRRSRYVAFPAAEYPVPT